MPSFLLVLLSPTYDSLWTLTFLFFSTPVVLILVSNNEIILYQSNYLPSIMVAFKFIYTNGITFAS